MVPGMRMFGSETSSGLSVSEEESLRSSRGPKIMERHTDDMTVSPDVWTILYTQLDEEASDLMLVENFR
jgi:hypothetical protein